MRRHWIVFALGLVLGLALMAGPLSMDAKAQRYDVALDFVVQSSALAGQDITIIGRVTLLVPVTETDTVTATVTADDTGPVTDTLEVDPAMDAGTVLEFGVIQATFVPGEFLFSVASEQEGQLFAAAYPAPNEEVAVELTAIANGLGTAVEVRTTFGLGAMTIIQTRFDVEYVVDGVTMTDSDVVYLIDSDFLALIEPAIDPDVFVGYETWEIVRTLHLEPGPHEVDVRVVDQSLGTPVHEAAFFVLVPERLADLEADIQALNDTAGAALDDFDGRLGELEGQSAGLQRIGTVALPAAVVGSVALVVALIALLVQLGMLKLGRRPPEE